jgi:DNA-binding beta-propeller fold protein YncE
MKTVLILALTLSSAAIAAGQGAGGGRGGAGRVIVVPDAPLLDYTYVPRSLSLPEGRAFSVVASVAVNSKGHVFVYQRAAQPLVEFDERGRFVRDLREGTDARAHSVRIDAEDNIWTVDAGAHTVTKLSPRGDVLLTLGTSGVEGSGADAAKTPLFNAPADVAVAANGDVFVVQGENGAPDPRVIRFDRAGRFITTWSLAYAEGRRSSPHAIVIDKEGLVYVADRDVMRIRIFRPDGTPVRDIQMGNRVYGLALDPDGTMWIATGNDGMVQHIDATGKVLGYMGKAGRGEGLIGEGHLLALAPNGDIYVADTINSTVHEFVRPS